MTFSGVVTRISGEADLQRNTLQAKVSINNPDARLRPEMLVRARFYGSVSSGSGASKPNSPSGESQRYAIYVPETALVDDARETHVWVVAADQSAEFRAITLSEESRDGHRRVLSGLRSGERVILPPHTDLKPGTRVSPRSEY